MKKKKIKNNLYLQKKEEGFSIVEMVIAVGIFAIAMTVAMTAFLNISDTQRKAESVKTVSNSLNFALDSMSREIRTGKGYNVTGGGKKLEVDVYNKPLSAYEKITYSLSSGNSSVSQIRREVENNGPVEITPPEAFVESMEFVHKNTGKSMVTIIIRGSVGFKKKTRSYFNLQTTVSKRGAE